KQEKKQRTANDKNRNEKTRPEYYKAISLAPQELKQRMVKNEETHPDGRVEDLDGEWGNNATCIHCSVLRG
ncbi:citrate lyase holo-[acyl-carrier protein] synthase, partial [Enterococcus faecalis]|uniref:citrate lyase holo-[acyl-carrier protein] synthase n=1 Tax=Enterococcus faecalis TaxID=1351 RepID=UPI0022A80504